MFCGKTVKRTVCPVAADPEHMDQNGYDFWTQRPPKPPNPLQTSSPKNPVCRCHSYIMTYQQKVLEKIERTFSESRHVERIWWGR